MKLYIYIYIIILRDNDGKLYPSISLKTIMEDLYDLTIEKEIQTSDFEDLNDDKIIYNARDSMYVLIAINHKKFINNNLKILFQIKKLK